MAVFLLECIKKMKKDKMIFTKEASPFVLEITSFANGAILIEV